MKSTGILFSIVLALTTAACTGGGGRLDDAQLTEDQIDFKRVTAFDGRVLDVEVTARDGSAIKLNTARDSAYSDPLFRSCPITRAAHGRFTTLQATAPPSFTPWSTGTTTGRLTIWPPGGGSTFQGNC